MWQRFAQGPARGAQGATIKFTPCFPLSPQQASPGNPPNTSSSTIQPGAVVQFIEDGGTFGGYHWVHVHVMSGSVQTAGTTGLTNISQPFDCWVTSDVVRWGGVPTGKQGTTNKYTPCFPMGPKQASPGNPPNTSHMTLQPGAIVHFIEDGGVFGGYRWIHVEVLSGSTKLEGAIGISPIDPGFKCWITDDVVTWNAPAAPAQSAKSAPNATQASSSDIASATQNVISSIHNQGQASLQSDGTILVVGSLPGAASGNKWLIASDGSGRQSPLTMSGAPRLYPKGSFNVASIRAAMGGGAHALASAPTGPQAPKGSLVPTGKGQTLGYTVSGTPPHAYLKSSGKDLGLLVNPGQVVKPTSGGKLWALYNLAPDGSLSFDGAYGTVPGAPPPPNASPVQVVHAAQYAPAVAPPPPPPPSPYGDYATPLPSYGDYGAPPAYGDYGAPPAYGPPAYGPPAYGPPAFGPPTFGPAFGPPPPPAYAPAPQIEGVAAYDPMQAALIAGTLAGEQAGAAMQQQQVDPLTASILQGGGVADLSGSFSGMPGGFDPTTLAALSGGDADAALEMAMQNGNYDPTGGFGG